ncbi:MAG: hemolysin activation/secretion protein [Gammaproteobacteria bacterium]|jgi:hemolysin activation/secretion protein
MLSLRKQAFMDLRALVRFSGCALTSLLLMVCAVSAQTTPGTSPGAALPQVTAPPANDVQLPPPAFPIPPAVERPLDEEEGQRLFVKTFQVEGVTDRPKSGIDTNELGVLIEELRIQRQGLDKVDDDGFSTEERDEIATFMKEVVRNPEQDYLGPEYEVLIDRLRELKEDRDAGMTVGQMQQVANAVTEYYRSAGFVLAQAYIPAQEVEDGVVRIAVLEGTLGNVLVEGNEDYSSDLLVQPFEELIGAPVSADGVESAILTASDYPGLSVFGVFRPGRVVGTTDMVLRVQDERPWALSVRMDNHGTRFTGRTRTIVEGAYNNPTGAGDRLTATAVRQFKPSNSAFGELRYERPFWTPGLRLGVSASRNPFDVGAEVREQNIAGSSTTVEAYADRSMVRSRELNVGGRVGLRRTQEETSIAGAPIGLDEVAYVFADLRFDSIDAEDRAINAAEVGVAAGLGDQLGGHSRDTAANQTVAPRRTSGVGSVAANDFWLIKGSASRFQKITDTISVTSRVEGQFSNALLTSTNQYSIGGPSNVRAYNVSEFVMDRAFFASMEWTFDAPGFADSQFREGLTWGQVLKVSFFADYAWGSLNDPAATDIAQVNVTGIGSGVSFNLPGSVLARLQYARHVGGRVPGDEAKRTTGNWWLDVSYQF